MAKEMSKTEKMRKLFANKALSAEDMDDVAGGTTQELADDSRFLNVLLRGHPAQPDRYGEEKINYDVANNSSRIAEVKAAWAACGVTLKDASAGAFGKKNVYYYNGEEVTRAYAMQRAMSHMGKFLEKSDWYWG